MRANSPYPRPPALSATVHSPTFAEIARPKYADTLRFPSDITELDTVSLSKLMGQFTEMYAYASCVLAKAACEEISSLTEEAEAKGRIFRESPGVNSQARWRRDAVLMTDSRLGEVNLRRNRIKIRMETAKAFVTIYDRYVQVLSRELTRRTSHGQYTG